MIGTNSDKPQTNKTIVPETPDNNQIGRQPTISQNFIPVSNNPFAVLHDQRENLQLEQTEIPQNPASRNSLPVNTKSNKLSEITENKQENKSEKKPYHG